MIDKPQTLVLLEERFAMCQLPQDAAVPSWATVGSVTSATRTPYELAIICEDRLVPTEVEKVERNRRMLRIQGPIAFGAYGILAALARPLAEARISIYVTSTFETDYIMVTEANLAGAIKALETAGHTILNDQRLASTI